MSITPFWLEWVTSYRADKLIVDGRTDGTQANGDNDNTLIQN